MTEKETRIPEKFSRRKLNSLYREIPLTDGHFRLLRKYFSAMANLYGIIPLWKAFEVIRSQNQDIFSEQELAAFAEIARHEREDYYILGAEDISPGAAPSEPLDREIIDIFQASDVTGAYEETRRLQSNKPYYIPEKKELLQYSEMTYCEPTLEYVRFMGYIGAKVQLDEQKERRIFTDVVLKMRVLSLSMSEVTGCLNSMGVYFQGLDDVNTFANLYGSLNNNFRMQCNRGHTPNEIAAMFAPETGGEVTVSTLKKKVGRNDPCPCGSGKKYKKCCGR